MTLPNVYQYQFAATLVATLVEKSHTEAEFDDFKSDIEILVTDGQLMIMVNGSVFMQYSNSSIKKE